MSSWINVKDKLPTRQRDYLAVYHFNLVPSVYFIGIRAYFPYDENPRWQQSSIGLEVTHWQELPELPEELKMRRKVNNG